MSHGIRRPHEAVDYAGLQSFLPPPPEYFEDRYFAPPEEIERLVADEAVRLEA